MNQVRGALLFARSRHWVLNLLVIATSAVLIAQFGPVGYSLDPRGLHLIEVAAQLPLLSAIAIPASLASPVRAKEALASRDLRPWRFAHVVGLTLLACVICAVAATHALPSGGSTADISAAVGPIGIVRNLLALSGAALIATALVGPTLGWVAPLAWAVVPYMALPTRDTDPAGILTLLMQPDSAVAPLIVAVAGWIVGAALAISERPLRDARVPR